MAKEFYMERNELIAKLIDAKKERGRAWANHRSEVGRIQECLEDDCDLGDIKLADTATIFENANARVAELEAQLKALEASEA